MAGALAALAGGRLLKASQGQVVSLGQAVSEGNLGISCSPVSSESSPVSSESRAAKQWAEKPFRFALNTSTIMGQKLSVPEYIDVAANAGYDGIEPWIRDLEAYQQSGGKLADLRKRLENHNLAVVGAIGFSAGGFGAATCRDSKIFADRVNISFKKGLAESGQGTEGRFGMPSLIH